MNRPRDVLRLALAVSGAALFVYAAFTSLRCIFSEYNCKVADVWAYILAVALVFAPFSAFAGVFMYLLMLAIPFGLAFLGLHVGTLVSGKGSALAIVGLLGGLLAGFAIVVSDAFDKLLVPMRWLANHDD